jgi:hypothetical protein
MTSPASSKGFHMNILFFNINIPSATDPVELKPTKEVCRRKTTYEPPAPASVAVGLAFLRCGEVGRLMSLIAE